MADQEKKTSYDLEQEMKLLERQFRALVTDETLERAVAMYRYVEKEGKDDPHLAVVSDLIGIVRTNRSEWSGGCNITNLVEQLRREVASRLLAEAGYPALMKRVLGID